MRFYENELFLISRMLFRESHTIFVLDPGKICRRNCPSGFVYVFTRKEVEVLSQHQHPHYIINISGVNTFSYPLNFEKVDGIISFSPNKEISEVYNSFYFHYTTDERAKIRWVMSENFKSARFLTEVEEEKLMVDISNLFSFLPQVMKWVRVKSGNLAKVTSGRIQFFTKQQSLFPKVNIAPDDTLSVHIHEAIQDGLIVIRFEIAGKIQYLIKVAANAEADEKLKNEAAIIDLHKGTYFNHLEFPLLSRIDDYVLLRFSEPVGRSSYYKLQRHGDDRFMSGVFEFAQQQSSELYALHFLKNEGVFDHLVLIRSRIEKKLFPRGLSPLNFVKLYRKILAFLNRIEKSTMVKTTLSNIDMKPENIGYLKDKIVFFNWANTRKDYPFLFDLFHYTFTYVKSFENMDIDYLLNDLEYIKFRPEVEEMQNKNQLNFEFNLNLYLCIQSTKEMASLLIKRIIPPEGNIQILRWLEVFEHFEDDKNPTD